MFHHADHVHPFQDNIIGPSGSVVIPRDPHNVATTFYRLTLTVTDPSSGLSTSSQLGRCQAAPGHHDAITPTTPRLGSQSTAYHTQDLIPSKPLSAYEHVLDAPSPQNVSDGQLVFDSWSDGGAQSHAIIMPDANASYMVTYDFVAVPESAHLAPILRQIVQNEVANAQLFGTRSPRRLRSSRVGGGGGGFSVIVDSAYRTRTTVLGHPTAAPLRCERMLDHHHADYGDRITGPAPRWWGTPLAVIDAIRPAVACEPPTPVLWA